MQEMGIKPDKITHHFMVLTFAKAGVFQMADSYIQDMIGRNELPTLDMYSDLATEACGRSLPMLVRDHTHLHPHSDNTHLHPHSDN